MNGNHIAGIILLFAIGLCVFGAIYNNNEKSDFCKENGYELYSGLTNTCYEIDDNRVYYYNFVMIKGKYYWG